MKIGFTEQELKEYMAEREWCTVRLQAYNPWGYVIEYDAFYYDVRLRLKETEDGEDVVILTEDWDGDGDIALTPIPWCSAADDRYSDRLIKTLESAGVVFSEEQKDDFREWMRCEYMIGIEHLSDRIAYFLEDEGFEIDYDAIKAHVEDELERILEGMGGDYGEATLPRESGRCDEDFEELVEQIFSVISKAADWDDLAEHDHDYHVFFKKRSVEND